MNSASLRVFFFFLALKYIDDLQNWNKFISPYFKLKDLDNVYEISSNVTPFVMEQFGKNVVIIDFCFEKMVVQFVLAWSDWFGVSSMSI